MIKKLRTLLHLIVLLLIMGYYGAVTTFTHTHISESGDLVTHSHPYSSPTHQHSENSLQLIASFTFLASIVAALVVIAPYLLSCYRYDVTSDSNKYFTQFNSCLSRGPPALSI
ncbi:MAG: hypothetical protein R3Y04_08355 [Rikenellaceae bacterium]